LDVVSVHFNQWLDKKLPLPKLWAELIKPVASLRMKKGGIDERVLQSVDLIAWLWLISAIFVFGWDLVAWIRTML
jgi:hypothetical protein